MLPNGSTLVLAGGSVPMRRTLPPSDCRFCGLVGLAASPVVTHRAPSGAKRVRQPEWRPEAAAGMPVTSGTPLSRRVQSALTSQRTTRTSLAVM